MLNNLNFLFMIMLLFSSIFVISSNNWLASWFGLEINMMAFIPLIYTKKNNLTNEVLIKYFIIQAIGSSTFLFTNLINSLHLFTWEMSSSSPQGTLLILIPLMLKLGLAPLQFWFISIIEGLNWFHCFLLLTWQKIGPLFLMFYLHPSLYMILFMASLSLIISPIAIFNQISLRKIFAYSSINHLSWMLIASLMSKNMVLFYFGLYSLMLLPLTYIFSLYHIYFYNNLIHINSLPLLNFMLISILSLGGLPPLLGFLPKWIIFEFLLNHNLFSTALLLIFSSLFILFIYFHIIFNAAIAYFMLNKWLFFLNKNYPINFIFISLFTILNIFTLLLFNLY
uniref:NADH-ubiquinone oxidoreductase chain 2 n=1 Tax=Archipsocus nomas TaxID=239250 RepID=A0A343QCE8_9NEOP|nr:NADH dehydrogenase subunit 2 [Archipsocus nomas]ATU07095.1 NADH dehydrogenase subunit 2 [Archipsocus nomas]